LAIAAVSFALPHVAVSVRPSSGDARHGDPVTDSLLAMASEAASVGPQLCVILATADIYDKMPRWHLVLHALTTLCFVLSVGVCAWLPAQREGMAVAPALHSLCLCLALDVAAMVMLVTVFPVLRDWLWWVLVVVQLLFAAALSFKPVREPIVDMMEPIMPFQSSREKRFSSGLRDGLRGAMQVLALISACAALGGAMPDAPDTRPTAYDVAERYNLNEQSYTSTDHGVHDVNPDAHRDDVEMDYGFEMPWLMLRWQSQLEAPESEKLLEAAAQSMGMTRADVAAEEMLVPNRVMLFRFSTPIALNESSARQMRWHDALSTRHEAIAGLAELKFPAQLDASMCDRISTYYAEITELGEDYNATAEEAEMLAQPAFSGPEGVDSRDAYHHACMSWHVYRGDYHSGYHEDRDHEGYRDYYHHAE